MFEFAFVKLSMIEGRLPAALDSRFYKTSQRYGKTRDERLSRTDYAQGEEDFPLFQIIIPL